LKVYICSYGNGTGKAVISAYNRGHAIKLLSKKIKVTKEDTVVELDTSSKKGNVVILEDLVYE
jgi:hypothetical protein